MARNFRRREPLAGISEINVTPLIDLAFALLIIFMITAPLLEQSIALQLPAETPKPQEQPAERVIRVISVQRDGTYFWGEDVVTVAELEARIADLADDPEAPVVRLRGDANVPYQAIVTVLDLLKQYEIRDLAIDTRVE